MATEQSRRFLFTSESVGKGHPDKICDQISDSIVDACLEQDRFSRVAVDAVIKSGMVMLVGELTTSAVVDFEEIAREVLRDAGYTHEWGLDPEACTILTHITKQSMDISNGLEQTNVDRWDLGAGDQGIMFGYATDETPERMPLTASLAHTLGKELAVLRKTVAWLGPDSKTQVTMEYEESEKDGISVLVPIRVDTIVISTQHKEEVETEYIREFLVENLIKKVVAPELLVNTKYVLQPSGKFVVGGPKADSGLTGRKLVVDSYGGWGAHGGGAYSGKDWSKVDRTGAYAARWIAKSLVDAGLCKRVLVQVSYAIGVRDPISLYIDTYGSSSFTNQKILAVVKENWSLRLGDIVKTLHLDRPIYRATSVFGHFGRSEFPWEQSKSLDISVVSAQENGRSHSLKK
ncbi:S-adenosylmethionine synthetase [Nematocida ausubeli]|uniref:S-adenosylmethionine synthase n=1 Tax=Nematocida ausubeli (strain ATCC PRA-371 / ERTm2) TaxID=1913371 RepID=A0A086J5Q4_NEMA1|nr:methionine adenosyltransferase [Nematocida ausubeli]KAI5133814.1 S-adenosylmethionine synthetase [Nematocida ausubeli]KAI5134230.1 S-adenosylmethionine synthetase [Nematocida ausubeli]KAI5148601.1 S-adenosylmethionine synthetase [Nematocida ausubeli]KAI5149722.1 S-adenosylmethionine synthetase [Nematocida ausubeli]KAI5163010.1 S-adenosylmethionine synthetase [Nematocida ausubeli]